MTTCPKCKNEISDKTTTCPGCGVLISGGVFDFGMWSLISLESNSFWFRSNKRDRYNDDEKITKQSRESAYRINKTKGQIIVMWLLGLFGSLAFHYFAVGRILSGSIRLFWSAIWWALIILMAFFSPWDSNTAGVLRVFSVALFVLPVIDIIKISLGWFRDVFGKYIT